MHNGIYVIKTKFGKIQGFVSTLEEAKHLVKHNIGYTYKLVHNINDI